MKKASRLRVSSLMSERGAKPSELEALYGSQLGKFRRVAAAIAGSAEDGSEAVQEAFAKALANRRRYRPARGPLDAWVWRIVLNEASSAARRRRQRGSQRNEAALLREASSSGARPGFAVEGEALALLAQLPERERLTLFLRYVADLDYAGIAEILGVEKGTVGAALSSGRGRLRDLLKEGAAR